MNLKVKDLSAPQLEKSSQCQTIKAMGDISLSENTFTMYSMHAYWLIADGKRGKERTHHPNQDICSQIELCVIPGAKIQTSFVAPNFFAIR
jgi:hypothetical protein